MKDGTEFLDELKDRVHELYDENHKLKEEINRLNNRLKTSNDTCNYLRNTIDKAIEYMDRRDLEWGSDEHNKMMDILKGSDKE
jgi:cell division septum initiation protein DivIVA